ncbi:MAG TPA: multiheme c-type cytochrome [Candidatus Saccharimonadales bacterium]|nr:multiheme c-type cytochrome [Candidatus Saccharimonadales bacterium]
MARRAAYLKKAQKEPGHRLLVAGGDFFSPGSTEERLKGVYSLKAFRYMKYDAIGLADFDFSHGLKTLQESIEGLPVVTTNLVWSDSHKPVGEPMIVKRFEGIPSENDPHAEFRVAVLSFMDERLQGPMDFYLDKSEPKVVIQPLLAAAQEWVPKARKKADLVVALVHINSTEAVKLATQVPGMDVIVTGHTAEEIIDPPRREGSTWVVSNGDRGRFVGELRFNVDRERKFSDPAPRQVTLDQQVGEDSLAKGLVAEFHLKLDTERAKKPSPSSSVVAPTQWATFQVCVNCHQAPVDSWSHTPHAQAYATLVKSGNQKDEKCLSCHVLGLKTPGGFDPANPQPIMAGVQCESCHGPGVQHSIASDANRKQTIVGKPDEKTCRTCHTPDQSPQFDFAKYWEKIKH